MIIVSISIQAHNASICILENEKILLLLQEERVSRIKNDSSSPFKMLDCIATYTQVIDYLCLTNMREEEKNIICDFLDFNHIKVCNTIFDLKDNHHLYHASSSFYSSGFEESACLVIDGWGSAFNDIENNIISVETTSIYYASYPNYFTPIYKNLWQISDIDIPEHVIDNFKKKFNCIVDLNHHFDIGVMYGSVTNHLGYSRVGGQGKTMGLFSYGKPNKNIPNMLCKNSISSNMNLFSTNRTLNTKLFPYLNDMNFQKKADLSYSIQQSLEKIFLERINFTIEKTKCKNIVFSGGCALNVVGNSKIKNNFPEINFYVDPIAHDACQSLGAAKFYYHKITNSSKISKLNNLYFGKDYNIAENKNKIKSLLDRYNLIKY